MADTEDRETLLVPGETCWRLAPAGRVAFLVDGEAFFGAVADALERARRRVWLLGWDFHTRVELRRGDDAGDGTDLVGLLERQVREHGDLDVRVLAWDFAMLYALEREFLPLLQFGAKTHRRIHFQMDDAHPATASQHQKIVVVDDALAFVGGFDLTAHRWDTRDHAPDDPRRVTPDGETYGPFHDVQIAVDGDAAAALGELARDRWERATGERIDSVSAERDPWPESLPVHVREVEVGIARTAPAWRDEPEIREVEALYEASIAAAKRWIYVENQYLTSGRIGDALARRLEEPDGPEVVLVGPRENSGWLEESTMGALRDRLVRQLRDADASDRLRVLYPHQDALPDGELVNVHAKVMVGDDDFVRVGSANLSNRSMGLDRECDLAFQARGREPVERAIARFRDDLLAEHLGTTPDRVAEEIRATGSLVRAVDALAGGERTLRPLELEASPWTAEAVDALGAADPEAPVPLEELVMRFEVAAECEPIEKGRSLVGLALTVAAVGAVALALRTTPLGDWVTQERLAAALGFFRDTSLGPLVATGIFVAASLLLVPVVGLTIAAGLALGPFVGFLVAWTGSVASAAIGYFLGSHLWRESVRRLAGQRLHALSERLARRGVLSTALLRVVPVAPFMVVNLVAGASHVRARDFIVGTALGMLPGTILLVVAADGTRSLLDAFGVEAAVWLGLAVVALAAGVALVRRRRRRREGRSR